MNKEENKEQQRILQCLALLKDYGSLGQALYQELQVFLSNPTNQELQTFHSDTLDQSQFDEKRYLHITHRIIELLEPYVTNINVAQAILDLSRLHFEVREQIDEFGLWPQLSCLAAQNPKDFTGPNQILISDMVYSYYYRQARTFLETQDWDTAIDYLKSQYEYWRESVFHEVQNAVIVLLNEFFAKTDNKQVILDRLQLEFVHFESLQKKLKKLII